MLPRRWSRRAAAPRASPGPSRSRTTAPAWTPDGSSDSSTHPPLLDAAGNQLDPSVHRARDRLARRGPRGVGPAHPGSQSRPGRDAIDISLRQAPVAPLRLIVDRDLSRVARASSGKREDPTAAWWVANDDAAALFEAPRRRWRAGGAGRRRSARPRAARAYSRFMRAMFVTEIAFGQAASHS